MLMRKTVDRKKGEIDLKFMTKNYVKLGMLAKWLSINWCKFDLSNSFLNRL